jgi:peptidoglycan hydrolase-like protein with peptidoglycan-binding domain
MPHVGEHVRRFLVVTLVTLVAAPILDATPASAASVVTALPSATALPRKGDHSMAVVRLQQLLIHAGIHVTGGADGAFGPGTAAAVATYQRTRALPSTGVVDLATATALGLVQPRAQLAPGAGGAQVAALQRRLQAAGVHVRGGADGQYGPATALAVRAFQKTKGVPVTGTVDAYTAALLARAVAPAVRPAAAALPRPGQSGPAVRDLQRRLILVGARPAGGVDGVYGRATIAAVATFQRWMGLPHRGVLDIRTQRALNAASRKEHASTVPLAHFPLPATCMFWDTYGAPRAGGRHHEGTDIFAHLGTPVFAVANGRITKLTHNFAGSRGGNQFWLTAKDGTKYFYGHLDHFARGMGVGVPVHAGDVLGYAGKTGLTTVVHLHFEVHPAGGGPVNPYPVLKRSSSC